MHFREWKVLYFDQNFTEVCSYGSDWQHHSIGLDNGLAPNMRLAIIGRNSATVHHYISKVTMDPNRHTIRRRFDVITTLSLHRGFGWGVGGWGGGWGGRWGGGVGWEVAGGILPQFTDAYMRHWGVGGWVWGWVGWVWVGGGGGVEGRDE